MNCKKTRQHLLADYLDGEIAETQKAKIDEHLLNCGKCQAVLSEIRKTSLSTYKNAEELSAPDDLWNKISEKIVEQEQNRFGVRLKNIWEKLTPPVWFARSAFAGLLILVVASTTHLVQGKNDPVYTYLFEQASFMDNFDMDDENDFFEDELFFDETF